MESSASAQGPQVVILLGSKSDMEHRAAIARGLDRFAVTHETRIASAHRVTRYLLDLLDRYERDGQPRVYITVAGRSNALSGVVDANSRHPVIACPPYGERFGGMDLLSTVRMPGGVAPMLVLEPEGRRWRRRRSWPWLIPRSPSASPPGKPNCASRRWPMIARRMAGDCLRATAS